MKIKNTKIYGAWVTGVLFIVFAMSLAFATFFEKDFGALAARAIVYEAWWFEFILFLLLLSLIWQMISNKLYKRNKLTIFLFHWAFVFIIIGAGITRYFGFEGTMHIRENMTQNRCVTNDNYINLELKDSLGNVLYSNIEKLIITPVKRDNYREYLDINDIRYKLILKRFVPNAIETIVDALDGEPIVALILSNGTSVSERIFLKQGDIKEYNNLKIGFSEDEFLDIKISFDGNKFFIESNKTINEFNMRTKYSSSHSLSEKILLEQSNIYKIGVLSIVPDISSKKGRVKVINVNSSKYPKNKQALIFELSNDNDVLEFNLFLDDSKAELLIDNSTLNITYGALSVYLPFSLKLSDFILERYPGSNSPSSYKSEVVLIDKNEGLKKNYSIFMNHVLKYKGWRFYQSSYDKDEKGTILTVTKDLYGMVITYVGYFILFLFIVLSLLNKKSRFRTISKSFFKSSVGKISILMLGFVLFTGQLSAGTNKLIVDKNFADKFGEILVQDNKGRTEPLYTLSNEVLRKISRKTNVSDYSAMQIFIGLYFNFNEWQHEKIIKISNQKLRKIIGVKEEYIAFSDVVNLKTNQYKLRAILDETYKKNQEKRNSFDKEVVNLDERINICYMVSAGEFLKIFPIQDKSFKWYTPQDAYAKTSVKKDSLYLKGVMSLLLLQLQKDVQRQNYAKSEEIVQSIIDYQRMYSEYKLPSIRKIRVEKAYYKLRIYERLYVIYLILGFIMLMTLLYNVLFLKKLKKILQFLAFSLFVCFLMHSFGLAMRWYISGHAPLSNGYESMLFVSWVTILAGFIFSKPSRFVLSATSVLSGFTLVVAHLSFMNPQLTNLVPVLQSHWLTLHVSIIIGSYGFLGLGAVVGFIVLFLNIISTKKNKAYIVETIKELTVINYKSLTVGLYLLTIGTFLGAIWANESWGRYWGWDSKETWSLITIIVYSFVVHSNMIEGFKDVFIFNLLAVLSFSSVLMTYFGVNYYLSGLHSYAGGESVSIHPVLYAVIGLIIVISIISNVKYKKLFNNRI